MAVRYNKLWKILIDRKMKKKDFAEVDSSSRITARLCRYSPVTTYPRVRRAKFI